MAKAMTTQEFVRRAILVHGNAYDYTNTVYVNMRYKVSILCPTHGVFEQLPQAHLKGQGCPVCGLEKCKQTLISRYGVDNPMKRKDICEKARQTCLDRYGHEWARSSKVVQEKAIATNRKLRGVDYPLQSESVKSKMRKTVRDRYGKDFVGQVSDFRDKARQTSLSKYGTCEVLAAPSVRQKIKDTNQELYGGNAPLSSKDVQAKSEATCLLRYGALHAIQNELVIKKINDTKAKNHTFGTSRSETVLYDMLCEKFGKDDIIRQYSSDEYPFACDFYVVSRGIHIELNAHWSHGGHWFTDSDDDNDVKRLWLNRNTKYYRNAVHVWCEADVRKRNTAKQNSIKYVVFWDTMLRDIYLWFAMDCPDGHDFDKEYSWLPDRCFDDVVLFDKITGTPANLSLVAKSYQFQVFYQREIQMWKQNAIYKKIPLQVWLYLNRLQYLGKSPDKLTNQEVLRAFTISGVFKGYTVFDTSLMDDVVKKYDIHSVYDPCAGWGERLLYCYCNGVSYHGVDINNNLKRGYDRMKSDLNIIDQDVRFDDSSTYVPCCKVDAVITCPPYGSIEKYSDDGAENFDDEHFLQWWDDVVKNSMMTDIKYFCFQINQKWKQFMIDIVVKNGFTLIDELFFSNVKSGHFTRRHSVNTKKEFESMVVLMRDL